MAITLGDLRTFCQEIASKDASGSTAEREFMHWINGAMARLYREHPYDTTRRETKITVPPKETLDDVTLTQGSLALSSATGFTAKWLSERWGIFLGSEAQQEFELAAIGTPDTTATLRSGDEWILATATDQDLVAVKNKFLLTNVQEVYQVRLMDGRVVSVLPPEKFDLIKQEAPTQTGEYPIYCTFRNSYLEVWPSPAEDYYKLAITYRLAFEPFDPRAVADGGDADATTVEWDDDQLDVLKKAIVLEASTTQGKDAPVPYSVALMEFERALGKLREVAMKEIKAGPMGVTPPLVPRRRSKWVLPPRTTLEDI